MWRRPRTLVLACVVAAAALVPLFGDPRATPVTHPLWARLLLRALEMGEAVRASRYASQVFATLAFRDSLSLPADSYLRADGLSLREQDGQRVVSAASLPAEVSYALAIVQPGEYRLRARLSGPSDTPVTAEIGTLSGEASVGVITFTPGQTLGWVFGGTAHLDPGAYAAQFLLPAGCSLSRVEIAPPCLNPIEPFGGWRATAVTTAEDLAVTALRALDAEHELAPAASPLEMTGGDLEAEAPPEAVAERAREEPPARTRLRAGRKGLRAVAVFELPEAGLYTISAFTLPGAGQRWLVDGCRKAVVCAGGVERWRPILSQPLARGRHVLTLTLGAGGALQHVRIERKKSAPADYVSALERLGFEVGEPGPVARATALDAARFVREKRGALLASLCGDRVRIEEAPAPSTVRVADRSSGRGSASPLAAPRPAEPVEPPIGPPLLPPQPPATPTRPLG